MASIQTPTLVVELGSTPQLVELELCRYLHSLSDADRRRVVFVHIDTADEFSDLQNFHKQHAGHFRRIWQKIGVPQNINYTALPKQHEHTFVFPFRPNFDPAGAEGIRNNGHAALAFAYDRGEIRKVLEDGFRELETLTSEQNAQAIDEIQVCIVAFLGGGTGSGTVGDVAVEVSQMLEQRNYAQNVVLFCILPDAVKRG